MTIPDFSSQFNQKYQQNARPFGDTPLPLVQKIPSLKPKGSVLDLGVGDGRHARFFLKQGYPVTGIDISEEALKHLLEFAKEAQLEENLTTVQGSALSFESKQPFSIVLAIGLLHFFSKEDGSALIQKMQNLTEIGGINAIAVRMSQNPMNNLPHVFQKDELREYYLSDDWEILFYEEKHLPEKSVALLLAKKQA